MIIGTVRWFNPELGFGFIVVNEFEDAFVHYTAIRMKGFRTLSDGDIVMYDLARGRNGYLVLNVTPLR